jgi:hypothetical protein|tara:strand:+ start:458 stop:763 length:306 start_codon:yes stop_codon:yes gene_type:complete
VEVRLTSHFANAVTLYDFELAEHMNASYNDTKSTFTPFPRISERTLVSACIATGTFVFTYSVFKWATLPSHENDVQRGAPLPKLAKKLDLDNEVLERIVMN